VVSWQGIIADKKRHVGKKGALFIVWAPSILTLLSGELHVLYLIDNSMIESLSSKIVEKDPLSRGSALRERYINKQTSKGFSNDEVSN